MLTRFALTIVTALFGGVIPLPAAEQGRPAWQLTSVDSVVLASDGSSDDPSHRSAAGRDGDGFATDADASLGRFTIRLTRSGEEIREDVEIAAEQAMEASGNVLEIAPGNLKRFDETPPDGEIHVTVSSRSPCGRLGGSTIGCGGYEYSKKKGRVTVMAGVVWIAPGLDDDLRLDTVLHEMGHALGLEHYDRRHQGEYQIMTSIVEGTLGSYQAGDRAGLEYVAPRS